MFRRSILEYESFPRSAVDKSVLRGLQRFDERQSTSSGNTVFDWSLLDVVKAKSFVGVIQIPGLQIEILPKVERSPLDSTDDPAIATQESRQNLLFMLSMCRRIPFEERDIASLDLRRFPLWEALINVFVRKLLVELRRGQQHLYVHREETLHCVRGKIRLNDQVRRSAAHKHQVCVAFDDFSNDTWLNRILKATCCRLLSITKLAKSQQMLRKALLELADVEEATIALHDFNSVRLDRNSERFSNLLEFCRIVLFGTSPSPQLGRSPTFSLLFPMEQLFEEFVGSLLRRYAESFGLRRVDVHLQAESQRRWLLRDENEIGKFRLKPDVLIMGNTKTPAVILDTKWKRPRSDEIDAKNGVDQADIYQLFAYANRYGCPNNILLFPLVAGVSSKSYRLDGEESKRRLRVEFLDLGFDLRRHRPRLVDNLRRILSPVSN